MPRALETEIRVRQPYRLDLTVHALRRLSGNVVDVSDGRFYRRALADTYGTNVISISQESDRLRLRITGTRADRWIPTIRKMLGVDADLSEWDRRVAPVSWLQALAKEFLGVRPPRYPTLWEALTHAIVFQQISIEAAGAIMRRLIEALAEPLQDDGVTLFPFPEPHALLRADDVTLKRAGLSAQKIAHLRSAAAAVRDGLEADLLEALPSSEAALRLQSIRGIGPWSAAVVLLRGLGRLDVFPLKDSGVARSMATLSGDPEIDARSLLEHLGPVRGMLYFHLLLGRRRSGDR